MFTTRRFYAPRHPWLAVCVLVPVLLVFLFVQCSFHHTSGKWHSKWGSPTCNSCRHSVTVPFRILVLICHPPLYTRLEELCVYLKRQKYPEPLIKAGIDKAKQIPITELRNPRQRNEEDKEKIPFVITHNPNNHNILGTAKRFFPILQQSENMKELAKDTHIINSRRQAPNLEKTAHKGPLFLQWNKKGKEMRGFTMWDVRV